MGAGNGANWGAGGGKRCTSSNSGCQKSYTILSEPLPGEALYLMIETLGFRAYTNNTLQQNQKDTTTAASNSSFHLHNTTPVAQARN